MRRGLTSMAVFIALFAFGVFAGADEKSAEEIAWNKLSDDLAYSDPAFAYVKDDPLLPRVLLIGDSISIGYTVAVRELLKGKANVHRIPTNGLHTRYGLNKIESWLGEGEWDVIHFNWGLHDINRINEERRLDTAAETAISPKAYEENLVKLVKRLKKTNAKLIWASTTPVPEGTASRIPGDEVRYNKIAQSVMTREGVATNDLHGHILPNVSTMQRKANVHFHLTGSQLLARHVVEQIEHQLER